MLFEFIATIAAGFGLAGIAMLITHLSKYAGKKAPRWLVPFFAAVGIFGFQIHQEYNWFDQQVAKLPQGVTVVKKVEQSTWFRPWSFAKPQTLRFMAIDSENTQANAYDKDIYLTNLYLFERRRSVQQIPQVIDCAAPARADYKIPSKNDISDVKQYVEQTSGWYALDNDDPLYTSICLDRQLI